jgi:hypothetical protein
MYQERVMKQNIFVLSEAYDIVHFVHRDGSMLTFENVVISSFINI